MQDFYSLEQDEQQKIIDNIYDAVAVTVEQCDNDEIVDRYNYYLSNDEYELTMTFDDQYDHDLLDEYIFVDDVEQRNIVFGKMSFSPVDDSDAQDYDLIDVAYIVYDLDDDENNASTVILTF